MPSRPERAHHAGVRSGFRGHGMCFVNLVEPGDKVIVCQNGVFGGRMKENVERRGGTAVMVEDSLGWPSTRTRSRMP